MGTFTLSLPLYLGDISLNLHFGFCRQLNMVSGCSLSANESFSY